MRRRIANAIWNSLDWTLPTAGITALIVLLIITSGKTEKYEQACNLKGGLLVHAKNGRLCIKAEHFIELDTK